MLDEIATKGGRTYDQAMKTALDYVKTERYIVVMQHTRKGDFIVVVNPSETYGYEKRGYEIVHTVKDPFKGISDIPDKSALKRINRMGTIDRTMARYESIDFRQYLQIKNLDETIVKKGSKWAVMNKDKTKTLGTHDNKEDALDQLAAIEISKAKRGK